MEFSFNVNIILAIGILTVIGLLGGFAAKKVNFPTISGYIIIGIMISLTNIIPRAMIDTDLSIITDISLGIIGYLVGGSLYFAKLKEFGKNIAIITPLEALGAWVFVTLPLIFLGPVLIHISLPGYSSFSQYIPIAIVLGAISCATAPAASLAIIREYRASGPFTTTLLAIIVLDDALAVIAYAIASNFADSMTEGFKHVSWYNIIAAPLLDIFGSLILGTVLGFILVFMGHYIKKKPQLLAMVLGIIFLCVGLANTLGLSAILASMAIGVVVVNRLNNNEEMFGVINHVEGIIFAMFFTLAGAHFDYKVIKSAGILALALVIFRFIGKYIGVRLGATISKAQPSIKNYLGFGLFPIAGVTVGLAMLLKQHPAFKDIETILINAILASVIINEIIAPPLTKLAIFRSGEAYKKD